VLGTVSTISNIQKNKKAMFNQLMELVRESGQQAVVENPAVPNEQNEAVMQEASASIYRGLQDTAQTGGPGALKNLFQSLQNGDTNNPGVQQVADHFSGNLMQKFGMNSGAAKSLAASLIPMVLGQLMNRSRNADDSSGFSIGNILGSLMGGSQTQSGGGGLMGNLNSMGTKFGLDKDGDGDTDLNDLMSMFRR
jgi:hypothetical protein